MRINQNVMAYNAYRNLSANETSVSKSLEKLSSGLRINRAGDDAAGLVISQKLRAQVGGLTQATRNAQDGISVVQTAEGALTEVHNMLGRMRDLAVQAANTGANDQQARDAANKEVSKLKDEVDRIAQTTSFGSSDVKLLDGSYGKQIVATSGAAALFPAAGVTLTAGATIALTDGATTPTALATVTIGAAQAGNYKSPDELVAALNDAAGTSGVVFSYSTTAQGTSFSVRGPSTIASFKVDAGAIATSLDLDAQSSGTVGEGGVFQVGANGGGTAAGDQIEISIADMSTNGLSIGGVDLATGDNAKTAITTIDAAIKQVSNLRGDLGAAQNRFESVISNLQVTTENLTASESRIRDTDYAQEMVKFTRGQILNQAATSMLGQANKLPQGVLGLLQG